MNDRAYVLDASALLAFFYSEPGTGEVQRAIDGGAISAVNLSEVVAKLYDRGLSAEVIALNLADANLRVIPLDEATAMKAGELRAITRSHGLSLADRCCLATAIMTSRTALTADRSWSALTDATAIELIR